MASNVNIAGFPLFERQKRAIENHYRPYESVPSGPLFPSRLKAH